MANAATIAKPAASIGPERNPGQSPIAANPFVRATREVRIPFVDVSSAQLSAAQTQAGPFDVVSFGFLRNIVLYVTSTGSSGAATYTADAPWTALDQIQMFDTNGNPILPPVSGYELMTINRMTGAATVFDNDLTAYPSFSAVTASGVFSFKLRIPLEIGIREGLGALPNMSAAAPYRIQWIYNTQTATYATGPASTVPTVRVRGWVECYSQPPAQDARGNPNQVAPPYMGTTSYWSKQVVNISATGSQTIRITRTGNLWRNLLFITRDGTGARISTMMPDPILLQWDSKIMDNFGLALLNDQMRERLGFAAATGVYLYDFAHDFISKVGGAAEGRNLYWPTTQASNIQIQGIFGATGTLTILVNDVVPAEGAVYTQAG